MKTTVFFAAIILLGIPFGYAQNSKVGITNFSIHGFEQAMGITTLEEKDAPEPDLYFIGDGSTQLSEGVRLSDEIVKYTEAQLKTYLGYDILPTDLNRSSSVPDQMQGRLWVMETITDKKAFKQLGYDQVIEIDCRIGKQGKAGKYYKPFIELTIKITDKDNKVVLKKKEKLKLDDKIPASSIEMFKAGEGLSISFSKKSETEPQGIPATQLLDWYKQVLGNALMK